VSQPERHGGEHPPPDADTDADDDLEGLPTYDEDLVKILIIAGIVPAALLVYAGLRALARLLATPVP
jgi:hypothetical protein